MAGSGDENHAPRLRGPLRGLRTVPSFRHAIDLRLLLLPSGSRIRAGLRALRARGVCGRLQGPSGVSFRRRPGPLSSALPAARGTRERSGLPTRAKGLSRSVPAALRTGHGTRDPRPWDRVRGPLAGALVAARGAPVAHARGRLRGRAPRPAAVRPPGPSRERALRHRGKIPRPGPHTLGAKTRAHRPDGLRTTGLGNPRNEPGPREARRSCRRASTRARR